MSEAALSVLTDGELLRHITSFQSGLPYLVGQFEASLTSSSKLENYSGKLPQFAVRRRDLQMLERIRKATQDPRLQLLPQLQFTGVRRCAIEYNSLPILKWLHATRDKSPTLSDEQRLLSVAATCYFDNVEILDWLYGADEGPHERIDSVTVVAVCRAAGLGNIRAIRWFHEHKCAAFSPLVMDTAAVHGHLELVRYLHENRREGCTTRAMHGAALNGYHEVVMFLAYNRLEGADERTLKMAARAGHLRCVEILCRFVQPPPRGSGVWRFTEARQCAIQSGFKDVARFLAEQEDDGEDEKEKKRWFFGLFWFPTRERNCT